MGTCIDALEMSYVQWCVNKYSVTSLSVEEYYVKLNWILSSGSHIPNIFVIVDHFSKLPYFFLSIISNKTTIDIFIQDTIWLCGLLDSILNDCSSWFVVCLELRISHVTTRCGILVTFWTLDRDQWVGRIDWSTLEEYM